MFKNLRHIFIGTTVVASLSATAPALAVSLKNPTITGREADYTLTGGATLEEVLQGSCETAFTCDPGGNVKLMAPHEDLNDIKSTYEAMLLNNRSTSLSGILNNGKEITISSVTATDLYGESAVQAFLAKIYDPQSNPSNAGFFDPLYDSSSFMAQRHAALLSALNFEAATDANGLDEAAKTKLKQDLFGLDFLAAGTGGTLSYVNQDDDGVIKVGIANDLESSLPGFLRKELQVLCIETGCNGTGVADLSLVSDVQLSGLLKVAYDGKTEIISSLYSTNNDGLILADAIFSENGNYQVNIQGDPLDNPVAKVSEPSAVFGLMAVGGMLSVRRKLKKA